MPSEDKFVSKVLNPTDLVNGAVSQAQDWGKSTGRESRVGKLASDVWYVAKHTVGEAADKVREVVQGPCGEKTPPPKAKRIVVCCDGSWCGDGTDTTTNVEIFAAAFAGGPVESMRTRKGVPYYNPHNDALVGFFDGVGTNGSFGAYMLDGALGLDIEGRVVEAYQFIVEHYDETAWDGKGSQVYLIGLSRGAYTVRRVAGMINNLGILRSSLYPTPTELRDACNTVYALYANPSDDWRPGSPYCREFIEEKSHKTVRPPVKFMGLFDTVGAEGIPYVNAGDRLRYGKKPSEFYDQVVSSEVEAVWQALALTDRMAPFTPCFVHRQKHPKRYPGVEYQTKQTWFPGSHYDIGRQRFVLLRKDGNLRERILRQVIKTTNLLSLNVTYTTELANPPFEFLVQGLRSVDPDALPYTAEQYLHAYANDALPPTWKIFRPFTIDAYDHFADRLNGILRYVPVGRIAREMVDVFTTRQVLLDRFLPPEGDPTTNPPSQWEVGNQAYLKECNGIKYRSRAYQHYQQMHLERPPGNAAASSASKRAAGGALPAGNVVAVSG